jgi:hypothetical protein
VCVFWVGGTIALRATEGRKHGAAETEGCGEFICVVDDRRLWSVSLRVHGKSEGNLISAVCCKRRFVGIVSMVFYEGGGRLKRERGVWDLAGVADFWRGIWWGDIAVRGRDETAAVLSRKKCRSRRRASSGMPNLFRCQFFFACILKNYLMCIQEQTDSDLISAWARELPEFQSQILILVWEYK